MCGVFDGRREGRRDGRACDNAQSNPNTPLDLSTHSPDEVDAAAELQAAAFYSSYPLGPLDALLFYTFRVREKRKEGGMECVWESEAWWKTHLTLASLSSPRRAKSSPASNPR